MSISPRIEDEPDSGYPRLEQQIRWYDSKSKVAQRFYKYVKFGEICCAVFIPFFAKSNPDITAILGMMVVILEGLQQINQWSHNWITYRSTCEALRHEKYSYLGKSGAYSQANNEEAKRILTQRVESLISTEHAKWISRQEYDVNKTKSDSQNRIP